MISIVFMTLSHEQIDNVPPGATQSFKILFATFIKFALTVEGVKQ